MAKRSASKKPASAAERGNASSMVDDLFERIEMMGVDPRTAVVAYLANRRTRPDYPTLLRLCVMHLKVRGVRLGRQPVPGIEAKPPQLKLEAPRQFARGGRLKKAGALA